MDLYKYPAPQDQVAACVVDGSAVIVLADSGIVNVLNSVGTRIWELTDGSRTVQQIADAIQAEYAVTLDVAVRDVIAFLQNLDQAGALVLRDQPAP